MNASKKTSIALIGFMGSGKTAVGKVLAERLGKDFIDLDPLIEKKAGKTIPQIFQQGGEIAFREIEIDVARDVSGKKKAVIACGGGVILNWINIERLKQECVIVYLAVSPTVSLKRTAGENYRPLLDIPDRAARIAEMLRFRRPFYERAADFQINTSRLSVKTIADRIIDKLKER